MIDFTKFHDIAHGALEAIRSGKPYSLVRFGDGENSVVQYPEYCSEPRIQYVFSRALENRKYESGEIESVKSELIESLANADVVGIYDTTHVNILCRIYSEHLAGIRFAEGAQFCVPTIHFYLQQSGHLRNLIDAAENITLVTGRDVLEKFKHEFPGKEVDVFPIPSEKAFRLQSEADQLTEPHFPDIFNKIKNELAVRGTRHLFLIGAGFLGKIYCDLAKARGGIALDIGSVFDYWADVPTREGYLTVKEGRLELSRPAFRPAMSIDATPMGEKASDAYERDFDKLAIRKSPDGFLEGFRTSRLKMLAKWVGAPFDEDGHIRNYLPIGALVAWILHTRVGYVSSIDGGMQLERIASTLNESSKGQRFTFAEYMRDVKVPALAVFTRLAAVDAGKEDLLIRALRERPTDVFFHDFRVLEKLKQANAALFEGYEVFDLKLLTGTDFGDHSGFIRRI